jgi:hypothetical protein
MLDAIKGSNASRGIRFKLMNTIVICNPLILIVTDVWPIATNCADRSLATETDDDQNLAKDFGKHRIIWVNLFTSELPSTSVSATAKNPQIGIRYQITRTS